MIKERRPATDHPLDECACGDYRRDHKDGTGACAFNAYRPDLTHGYRDCNEFRLTVRYRKQVKK